MNLIGVIGVAAVLLHGGTQATARSIQVIDSTTDASLKVVSSDPETAKTFETITQGNAHTIEIPETIFSSDAYKTILVTMTWEPAEGSDVIGDVETMTLELPILLRSWDVSPINLRTDYFLGIGEKNVLKYEGSWPPGTQFSRFMGSMLLRYHYQENLGDPQNRHVRRITEVLLSSARQLANRYAWFQPNYEIEQYINESAKDQSVAQRVMQEIRGNILRDLLDAEKISKSAKFNCNQQKDFFLEIEEIASGNPLAVEIFYPNGNFNSILEEKKTRLLQGGICTA